MRLSLVRRVAQRSVAWAVLGLAVCTSVPPAQAAPKGAEHVSRLSYRSQGFRLPVEVDLTGADFIFKREPAFEGRKILRGALPISPGGQDQVGFAWDEAEGAFYLDLNQNLDLTDDPLGVFRTTPPRNVFNDVQIRLAQCGFPVVYVADVNPYYLAEEAKGCIFWVRSGWLGEIQLKGEILQLAVVDNMDRTIDGDDIVILKRGNDDLQELDDFYDPDRFPAMRHLYLGECFYDVSYVFEAGQTGSVLTVTFAERAVPIGQLELEGAFVKRLVLEGAESGNVSVAVVESRARRVPCPVGAYDSLKVYLETGDAFQTLFARREEPTRVGAERPAQLKLGAPLRNTVAVTREGNRLELTYHLLGVGGEDYAREVRSTGIGAFKPQFTVYQRGRELYRGVFTFA